VRQLLPVTPDVVDAQVVLEELDLSPDGRTAVVVRRRTRRLAYVRDLLLVDLDGGPPRPLPLPFTDPNHPRWSPDGRSIAFMASGRGGSQQIFLASGVRLTAARARPRRLTREAHGEDHETLSHL